MQWNCWQVYKIINLSTGETLSEQVFPGGYSRLKRMWNLPDFHFSPSQLALCFLSKPFRSSSTESCFLSVHLLRVFMSHWQWWPFLTRKNGHISKRSAASTHTIKISTFSQMLLESQATAMWHGNPSYGASPWNCVNVGLIQPGWQSLIVGVKFRTEEIWIITCCQYNGCSEQTYSANRGWNSM